MGWERDIYIQYNINKEKFINLLNINAKPYFSTRSARFSFLHYALYMTLIIYYIQLIIWHLIGLDRGRTLRSIHKAKRLS
jgi:hypothetical protein